MEKRRERQRVGSRGASEVSEQEERTEGVERGVRCPWPGLGLWDVMVLLGARIAIPTHFSQPAPSVRHLLI